MKHPISVHFCLRAQKTCMEYAKRYADFHKPEDNWVASADDSALTFCVKSYIIGIELLLKGLDPPFQDWRM